LSQFAFFAELPADLPPGTEPELTGRVYLPGVMREGRGGSIVSAVEEPGVEGTLRLYLPLLQR
jgi:hypothetical protein